MNPDSSKSVCPNCGKVLLPYQSRCVRNECILERDKDNQTRLQEASSQKIGMIESQINKISASIDQSGVDLPTQRFVVPDGVDEVGDIAPASDERQEQFKKFLTDKVEVAELIVAGKGVGTRSPKQDADSNSEQSAQSEESVFGESSIVGHACSLCRGYCCQSGGTHAFIDEDVLLRVRANSPEKSLDEIADVYREALPDESAETGCVFLASKGCTLGRELRSDICNQFVCEELTYILDRVDRAQPVTLVAVSPNGDPVRHKVVANEI